MTQNTLQAHRVETTLSNDGRLVLDDLPFQAGEAVEVIVLPRPLAVVPPPANPYPLRGTSAHYDRPFAPVAEDDWEALK